MKAVFSWQLISSFETLYDSDSAMNDFGSLTWEKPEWWHFLWCCVNKSLKLCVMITSVDVYADFNDWDPFSQSKLSEKEEWFPPALNLNQFFLFDFFPLYCHFHYERSISQCFILCLFTSRWYYPPPKKNKHTHTQNKQLKRRKKERDKKDWKV